MRFARSLRLAAVLALAPAALAAQSAGCGKALTQAEMNACSQEAYQIADADLNAAYRAAMNAQPDDEARALLRTAQRAWIPFRDAVCAHEADEMRGGSMAVLFRNTCLERLTLDRARDLWTLAR